MDGISISRTGPWVHVLSDYNVSVLLSEPLETKVQDMWSSDRPECAEAAGPLKDGVESEGKAFDLWPSLWCWDQKLEFEDAFGQNEFPPLGGLDSGLSFRGSGDQTGSRAMSRAATWTGSGSRWRSIEGLPPQLRPRTCWRNHLMWPGNISGSSRRSWDTLLGRLDDLVPPHLKIDGSSLKVTLLKIQRSFSYSYETVY